MRFSREHLLRRIALPLLLMTAASLARAQDVQVSATVSGETIGVQDQFELTVTVTGAESGQARTPRLPRLQGFKVVQGPNLATQFQWINGRTTSSKSFTYILLPEKEGQFTIDPIEVAVGNTVHRTHPITMRVTSASPAQGSARRAAPAFPPEEDLFGLRPTAPGANEVFVAAELDRPTAYAGQQITLSYRLYTQVNVTGLQLQESPPLSGFWVENLEVESQPTGTRKIINGKEYLEYTVKKQALFPTAPGKLKIPPSTFAISVRPARDFFSLLAQPETIYRKTSELTLQVKPLPEGNRPENFGDVVGSFTISSDLDKPQVAAGDAVSLRVKLAGTGNLKEIPDIKLPVMPDLTVYSSKRQENVHPVAGDLIGGDKSWEYVIVPKAAGAHEIPSLSFSYFDPQHETYETITTPALPLNVTPPAGQGTDSSIFAGIGQQSLTRQGTDINFIKLSGEGLQKRQDPLYADPWLYLLAGAPLLFNIGAFLYQRERARQSQNAAWLRSRRARRTALLRLRQAERAGRTEPRLFYDQAAAALAGYLGDRFNLPEISVTADSIERTMLGRAVAEGAVKETIAVLEECNFGRFVSASAAPERRHALSARIRATIDALESAQV